MFSFYLDSNCFSFFPLKGNTDSTPVYTILHYKVRNALVSRKRYTAEVFDCKTLKSSDLNAWENQQHIPILYVECNRFVRFWSKKTAADVYFGKLGFPQKELWTYTRKDSFWYASHTMFERQTNPNFVLIFQHSATESITTGIFNVRKQWNSMDFLFQPSHFSSSVY